MTIGQHMRLSWAEGPKIKEKRRTSLLLPRDRQYTIGQRHSSRDALVPGIHQTGSRKGT